MKLNSVSLTVNGTDYPVYQPNDIAKSGRLRMNYMAYATGASNVGRGEFLMTQSDYNLMVGGAGYGQGVLNMSSNQGTGLKLNVQIAGSTLYSTAPNEDSEVMVVVDVLDMRFDYTDTVSKSYNVQTQWFLYDATPSPIFYPTTLNSGSPWDWQDLINDAVFIDFDVEILPTWQPRNVIFDSIPSCKVLDAIAAKLFLVVGWNFRGFILYAPGGQSSNNMTLMMKAQGTDSPSGTDSTIGGGPYLRNSGRLPYSYDVIFPAYNVAGVDPFAERQYIKNVSASSNGQSSYSLPLPAPGYVAVYKSGAWVEQSTLDDVATQTGAAAFLFQTVPFAAYDFAGVWPFELDGQIRSVMIYHDNQGFVRTRITQDNRIDYCPTDRPGPMEFVSNQLVEGLGSIQAGCDTDGTRYVFGNFSANVVVQVTSNISGAGGKYNGTIYGGVSNDNGTGNLSLPDGLTSGQNCLLLNLDEQGQPTHWLITGSSYNYVQGVFWGMSAETPARPIVIIDRGPYRIESPQMLSAGSGSTDESEATDSWDRKIVTAGNAYGDTPVKFQICTRTAYDPMSDTPTLGYMYRVATLAADGRWDTISDETWVAINTPDSCSDSGT